MGGNVYRLHGVQRPLRSNDQWQNPNDKVLAGALNGRMRAIVFLFSLLVFAANGLAQTNRVVSPEISADRMVTFRVAAPKATEVSFFGDWMEVGSKLPMAKGADGNWFVTTGPIAPGVYIYHFVVDGVTMADPVNPQIKLRARTSASLLEVPGNKEIWEARDVPHGTVEIVPHVAKTLGGETRQALVYKPPGYDGSRKKYPVLYLLHGSNDTAAGWMMVGRANFILDNLLAEKRAREMVVVMPFGHAVAFDAPREEAQKNGEKFEEYLLKDLMPLVEERYRVASGAKNRAILGLSMGGGQALQIGLGHLDKFRWVGAFSAGMPRDFETRFADLLAKPDATNRKLNLLWIGCGRQDTIAIRGADELTRLLQAKGIAHTYRPTEGRHTFTVWREYLAEVAPLLFR